MRSDTPVDIAIIGIAAIFPGAQDAKQFWYNIQHGVDSISTVPKARWDIAQFYDPQSSAVDRLYCRRGGFIDEQATFAPIEFGIMPVVVEGAEPDQMLTLQVAARALDDAGYGPGRPIPSATTGVVLGRGGYLNAATARLQLSAAYAHLLSEFVRKLIPTLARDEVERIRREFIEDAPRFGPDNIMGVVSSLCAARIANRLDLHGPAYTVDAACASSLIALDQACNELRSGSSDLMIAGGAHLCQNQGFWAVFNQIGALSRKEMIRPFDRRADGLLIGEGIGCVVLKRVEEAERDGDRIYAVVRATGIASDGSSVSIMKPSVAGQLLAMHRAWRKTRMEPALVGLLEAHGTGTPTGDAAEVESIREFFGSSRSNPATIGSVKSMIGHTMPAAGIAGVIKAALAIHWGIRPPTLHCEQPRLDLEQTHFVPLETAAPWEVTGSRVACVNAFGFGGINAHTILQSPAQAERSRPLRRRDGDPVRAAACIALAAPSQKELLQALRRGDQSGSDGDYRLVLLEPTGERIARVQSVVESGVDHYNSGDGIWFSRRSVLAGGGQLAFVFSGSDAAFNPRITDVAEHLGRSISSELRLGQRTASTVLEANQLLADALASLGIRANVAAGYGAGEWSAAQHAGRIDAPGSLRFLDLAASSDLGLAIVEIDENELNAMLAPGRGINVLADDGFRRFVIEGETDELLRITGRLRSRGIFCQPLSRDARDLSSVLDLEALRRTVTDVCGSIRSDTTNPVRLFSTRRSREVDNSRDGIESFATDYFTQPIRLRASIASLIEDGRVRAVVEVGSGRLARRISAMFAAQPLLVLSSNLPTRTGLRQLLEVGAVLFCEGAAVDRSFLKLHALSDEGAASGTAERLDLGVRVVHPRRPLSSAGSANRGRGADAGLLRFNSAIDEILSTQRDVFAIWQDGCDESQAAHEPEPAPSTQVSRTLSICVASHPELLSHVFFHQREGNRDLDELYPVVPITFLVETMTQLALELVPQRKVIGLEHVRADRWMAVATALDVQVDLRYDGVDRVTVHFVGYCQGVVVLGDALPSVTECPASPLLNPAVPPIGGRELYDGRWMFHGPAYQGVRDILEEGKDGVLGVIEQLPARGALLDAGGQLLGYWLLRNAAERQMAMPVRIGKIDLFRSPPAPGAFVQCRVAVHKLTDELVVADLSYLEDGRLWARIEGWQARRVDLPREILKYPERLCFSTRLAQGCFRIDRPPTGALALDWLARRYLSGRERMEFDRLDHADKNKVLARAIVLKDALRSHRWERGAGEIFPAEVETLGAAATGAKVRAAGKFAENLVAAFATSGEFTVAVACTGEACGIAVEPLAPATSAEAAPSGLPPNEAAARSAACRALASARGVVLQKHWSCESTAESLQLGYVKVDGVAIHVIVDCGHAVAWLDGEQP